MLTLMTFMPYIWIAAVVFSVIGEAVYPRMTAVCVMPGAIAASIMALFSCPIYAQCIVFAVITGLAFILRFTVFKDRFKNQKDIEEHPEQLIGQQALVIEPIDNKKGCGRIKIHGTSWTARSKDKEATYQAGDTVELLEYSVDRFICR